MGIKTRKGVPRLFLHETSLASLECLAVPLVHQIVLSADFQCPKCQDRIDNVVSRMNDIESVVVNVLDKIVTLTSKDPLVKDLPPRQVVTTSKRPSLRKLDLLMKLCRLSKN